MDTTPSPTVTKETLLRVIDDLSTERLAELLEFALFIKARQLNYRLNLDGYMRDIRSPHTEEVTLTDYLLQGSVIAYDDPFSPIAETDWDTLS